MEKLIEINDIDCSIDCEYRRWSSWRGACGLLGQPFSCIIIPDKITTQEEYDKIFNEIEGS